MSLITILFVLSLLAVAGLTAIIVEQNRMAEMEARLELIRLARSMKRQQTMTYKHSIEISPSDLPMREEHGFFKLDQQPNEEDNSYRHAA